MAVARTAPPPVTSLEVRARQWIRQNPMAAAGLAMVVGSVATNGALVLWSRPRPVRLSPPVEVERVRQPSMPWLATLVHLVTADRTRATAAAQDAPKAPQAPETKEASGIEQVLQEAGRLWQSRQRIAEDSRDAVANAAKSLRSTAGGVAEEASTRLRAEAEVVAGLVHKAGEQALGQVRRSAAEHPRGTMAAAAGVAFALTLLAGRR